MRRNGSQNSYSVGGVCGTHYFFERSNVEHADGAITGSVKRLDGAGCRAAGTFRIEGDGTLSKAPTHLRALLED